MSANDTAVAPSAATVDHASDVAWSLLWPGLGQFCQRRFQAGAYFSMETVAALGVFVWSPPNRGLAFVAIGLVTIWSMLDAYRFERSARR